MNPFGEPIALSECLSGRPVEWMGCWDLCMTAADAVKHFKTLVEAVELLGAKIVDVKCGHSLFHHGTWIDNRLNNKCLVRLANRALDEPMISNAQANRLKAFFGKKVV